MPWDSKSVICSGEVRPGRVPAMTSPSSVSAPGVQAPLLERGQQVARFLERARARIDHDRVALAHRRLVDLLAQQRVGAGGVDVRAGREPLAGEHRRGRRGDGDDDVAARAPRPRARPRAPRRARALAAIRSQNFASFSALRENTFTRSSLRTAASASIWPCACQPEPKTPTTFASARASHFAATPPAAPVRIMPRWFASTTHVEVAALGVEAVDEEAHALAARGVGLVAEDVRRGHRALQDVQRRLRQPRALARHVDRVAGGVLAMHALDQLEGQRHGEQLLDVGFAQEEGHGAGRFYTIGA